MRYHRLLQRSVEIGVITLGLLLSPATATRAQTATDIVARIDLPVGRSYAIRATSNIVRASVASPEIADAIAVAPREMVINAKAPGETDVLVWLADEAPRHYRVLVHSPADRMQILVSVKFAEVRRDALLALGLSGLYRGKDTRVGTGDLKSDQLTDANGKPIVPFDSRFLTILSDFGTKDFFAMLQAQEDKGNVHTLAEPNIMAGNKEDASFLAGGEIPIPIAQPSLNGQLSSLTIQYREFGIRLAFNGEIISDSLIRLKVRPEVSSLDFVNAIVLSGFRIPALRTRRVESTLDLRRDQSLVISGLFNDERQEIRSGIPILMDIPILGALFSSSSWQKNETELVVIVTPVIIDPMHPRPQDVRDFPSDPRQPAKDALPPAMGAGSKPPVLPPTI